MGVEKEKITIYDVAYRAGVAISTVARVLNDSADVSEQTRSKVMQAISELKYRPDRTAKKLAQNQTRTIAIAMPTFTTPFHNELMKGIRTVLQNRSMDLLLCDLSWREPERTLVDFLGRGAVDGLLILGVSITNQVADELEATRAPAVLVGSTWTGFDSYIWDDVAGARAAVSHLIAQGHTRIGLIRSFADAGVQAKRVEGYQRALEDSGLPFDESLVVSGLTEKHAGFSEEAGYEAMTRLLEQQEPPTAVFASSDVQAVGAWSKASEAGLRVPEDIALVGYDDVKTSHYIGLSSVDQSMQETGRRATERLLGRIDGALEEPPDLVHVQPKLNVRRSSRHSRP
jgi:LacI family transcriptional regulator